MKSMRVLAVFAGALWSCSAFADVIKTVQAGATDQSVTVYIFVAADGTCPSSITHDESGMDLRYWRHGANAAVPITAATQTVNGAHTDGGFVELLAASCEYRLDLPDAAVAAGATAVEVFGTLTSHIVKGGTVLLSPPANAVQVGGQTASAAGTVTFPGTIASTTNITGGTITTVTNLTNAPTAGDFNATMKASLAAEGGIIDSGTAAAYTAGTPSVTLDGTPAFADDDLINAIIQVCGSTQGYCLPGIISDYVAATEVATLRAALATELTGTITYRVWGTPGGDVATIEGVDATDQLEAAAGSGTSDWNADERTAMRTILGIPATGTTPDDPTDGILDDIRDDTTNLPADPAAASVVAGRFDALDTAVAAVPDSTEVQAAAAAALDAETGANFTAIPKTAVIDYIAQFAADSGTTTVIVDATLNQADGFWRGVAAVPLTGTSAGMRRCVVASDQGDTSITVAPAFPAAVGAVTVQLVADALCAGVDPTYTP